MTREEIAKQLAEKFGGEVFENRPEHFVINQGDICVLVRIIRFTGEDGKPKDASSFQISGAGLDLAEDILRLIQERGGSELCSQTQKL